MGCSGSCPRRGERFPPGGGGGDTFQDEGVATDVGRVFDGAGAGKSKAAFSDGQVGLP